MKNFLKYIDSGEVTDDYTRQLEDTVIEVRKDKKWRNKLMKRWPIILSGLYVYLEMFVVLFPFIISNVANIDAVKKYVPKFFIDFGAWIMINWLFVAIALFVVPSVICVIIAIVFLILSFRNNNNMTPESYYYYF